MNVSQRVDNTAGRAIYTWDDTANREQLIYGDTGERLVETALLTDVASGSLYLRRNGNTVTLTLLRVVPALGKATHVIYNIPFGFRSNVGRLERVNGGASGNTIAFIVNQNATLYETKTGDTYSTVLTYPTNDAWPTALPGAAV